MRILLTTHAFLPRSLAGVETYTARLATALQGLGHDVHVLTAVHDLAGAPHSVRRTKVASLDVIEIVNTRLQGTLEATYRVPEIDEAIGAVLEELRPECVHAQHFLNLSSGMVPAARRLGACVVLTLHDYWLSCPRDGLRMQADGTLCAHVDHDVCAACLAGSPYLVPPLQRGAMRLARRVGLGGGLHALHRRAPRVATALLRLMRSLSPVRPDDLARHMNLRDARLRECVSQLDAVVAPTRFARDRALEWGVSPAQMRWMPLGAVPATPRARAARTRRRLAYVGSLSPHKGAHVLIEAARTLIRNDWTLDLFGNPRLDPEYMSRLQRLAAGDARIRFRGLVAAGEPQDLWSSVDLLVVPSLWWENSPLIVLEALAAGVPVVASRTGGVPELLSDGAGALVPPGDAAALRATLEDVLDGRLLAGPLAPLPLKTTEDGARELVALYAELHAGRDSAPGGATA
jgi:glycosyltransferase involved in cell wall biosynthesis